MSKRKAKPSRTVATREKPHSGQGVDPTRWPDETSNITFQNYVVGFFDLLGTRDRLANLDAAWRRRLQEGENASVAAAMLDSAKGVAQPITLLRRHFRSFFQGFLRTAVREPLQLAAQSSETKRAFRSVSRPTLAVTAFSDSMIVHLPLKDPSSDWIQFRAILCLLHAAGATSSVLSQHGLLLRAGIALGCGVELYKGEIYGPVLADAYAIESSLAKAPRVVVNQELLDLLTEASGQAGTDFRTAYQRSMAESAKRLLSTEDSPSKAIIVNYANDRALISYLKANHPNFVDQVTQALVLRRESSPVSSREKYDYLLNYISGPLAQALNQP